MRTPLIPFALLFSAAAFAQTTTIVGDVKGTDGKPLQNAQIQIVRTDIKANYKTKTDKKGHYVYAGLPIGKYNITVEVDGKVADQVNGVPTSTGEPREINFDLAKSAAAAAAGAATAPENEPNRAMSAKDKAEFEKQKKAQEEELAKNKALNDAFNAGKDAVTAKNWDAAIDNFEKASVLGPNQHVVWSNLADAYLNRSDARTGADRQSDLDKGIAAYAKAIAIKPDDPAYHNNYALGLAKNKKFDEAQAELTKAAQLDTANAGKYYYNLGAVYVNTGQAEPAGAAFKKAMDIDPNYADSYYQYGLYLIGKATTTPDGKIQPPDGTAEMFQKYLAMKPDGQFADAAKAMLQSMGSSVETSFEKPGSKKQPATKKK
ncbi:MAG TPA: carboxypeptidase regulatory-like domain-containing protein [Bryobacteraceae bacterium]|nr:carboxypeptidase regulatory-like domain-containing protein [Bryobacteraceae bacterium]